MLSSEELNAALTEARTAFPVASRWRHKKGSSYMILGHVIDADDGSVRVHYGRYDGPNYDPAAERDISFVRKISEWTVDRFVRLY